MCQGFWPGLWYQLLRSKVTTFELKLKKKKNLILYLYTLCLIENKKVLVHYIAESEMYWSRMPKWRVREVLEIQDNACQSWGLSRGYRACRHEILS
jgi:hypothetical protein